jgi:hypothetical protein
MPTPLELIDRLAAMPYTGAISDILDEMGYAHQVPSEIQSIQPGQTLAGRAQCRGRTLRGARVTTTSCRF